MNERSESFHIFGGDDTCWIFACASNEARHLDDIVFCISVLRKRGVQDSAIFVFADHPAVETHLGPYGVEHVAPLHTMESVLAEKSYRYVVAVCGGHGTEFGLQANTPEASISPATLSRAVRSIKGAQVAAVVLCQCYAGVFNYMTADRGTPEFVVIGSANFYPTISVTMRLKARIQDSEGAARLEAWKANVYQMSLFEWLQKPSDIDGDGEITLVDAYKYAGVNTIRSIQKIWVGSFERLRKLQNELEQAQNDGTPEVTLDAYRVSIEHAISILYNIQEPWLLNARLANRIKFA